MRPCEASMEKFPHKWWFLLHPNKKDLPTCWQPINQVLGQSLLPHKPAVRTSEMALGPRGPVLTAPLLPMRPSPWAGDGSLASRATPNPSCPSVSSSRTHSASLTPPPIPHSWWAGIFQASC